MKMDFPIAQTVKKRHSVRSYLPQPVPDDEKKRIEAYAAGVQNPFSVPVSFHFAEKQAAAGGEKLGTYGVIQGASYFVGVSAAPCALGLEAIGYSMEQVLLYLTSRGFGTCWLGGTFDRSAFSAAMQLPPNQLFPAISPIGYPREKRRILDSAARLLAKSDHRLAWDTLFFKDDFSHPLTQADAGDYAFPLEMLRLAPSAVNKQPWRLVKEADTYHFYARIPAKKEPPAVEIQRVDLGIGACHFHLAAQERGLSGSFVQLPEPAIAAPEQTRYLFSWTAQPAGR